ncbi:MAG: type 2 isopentenyl-diphosphate Delta-isomerase [Thermoplasmata archaeon]
MIESRKEDHIDICLNEDVELKEDYWDQIKFFHRTAPEINFEDIDISTEFLGAELSAPFMISAITGGYKGAEDINKILARSTEKVGIPLGVGSERPAIENEDLRESYRVIADYDIPLVFGNVGAPQLVSQKGKKAFTVDDCRKALDIIGGDFLAVHFNFLQEVVQPEGDLRGEGVLKALQKISSEVPVIAKETGAGISGETAVRLEKTGIKALDVGGMGGTSFSAVEYFRMSNEEEKRFAEELWDWGIPTPVSILECRKNVDIPLISTGGVRNGLHIAKALALGADIAGIAGGVLPYVIKGEEETIGYLNRLKKELKIAMFLLGCEDVDDLKDTRVIINGDLRDWIEC